MEVNINKNTMDKLKVLSEYDFEVAAWLIGGVKDGDVLIEDIIIPKQDAGAGSVDIDEEGIIDVLKNHKSKVNKIIGHFHTHSSMGAFWSGQDEENMNVLMRRRDYFIFIVMSHRDDKYVYRLKLMLNKPFKIYKECALNIINGELDKVRKDIDKIVKKKVKEKTYPATSQSMVGYTYPRVYPVKDKWPEEQSALYPDNFDEGVSQPGIETTLELKWIIDQEVDFIRSILADTTIGYEVTPTNVADLYDAKIDCPSKNRYKKIKKELEAKGITGDRTFSDGLTVYREKNGLNKTGGNNPLDKDCF